jgi:uncharacterized protein (TIGR02118 family)
VVTRIFLLTRLPHVSSTEFSAYWKDVHGPLVKLVPGLASSIQYHCTHGPYDGVHVMTFTDQQSLDAAESSPEWAAVIEDCEHFLDLDKVIVLPVSPYRVL